MLKWQYQADYRGRSWRSSIVEQRSEMNDDESIAYAYPKAVKFAVKETGLSPQTFPQSCPYSLEQILDEDFYPEGNNFDEYSENR